MVNNTEIGDTWIDDEGNEYVVKSIQDTVVISESVNPVEDKEQGILN